MASLFYKLPDNVLKIFRGRNVLWLLAACVATFAIVMSGLDWFWFTHTQSTLLRNIFFPAVILGGQVPIILPLVLLAIGYVRNSFKFKNLAWALGQAALLGLFASSFFKAFTGRIHPPRPFIEGLTMDISHGFRFGFFRGGVFWGWPSSHATVSFAVAMALFTMFPQRKWIRVVAVIYATYVALGVSMSIHWLSESVAGVILGALIGIAVGKTYLDRSKEGNNRK